MSDFERVEASNSCANCYWFEINIVRVHNTYGQTELEITCTTEHTGWHDNLTPDKDTDAIASPEKMRCKKWEAR